MARRNRTAPTDVSTGPDIEVEREAPQTSAENMATEPTEPVAEAAQDTPDDTIPESSEETAPTEPEAPDPPDEPDAPDDETDKPDTDTAGGVTFKGKQLVEFDRHITGPPRRSKGQRVWLTPALANRQGLTDDDINIITR